MINNKLLLSIFFTILCSNAIAYQPKDGNVTATVGPFVYKTDFANTSSGARSPYLGDFGLIAGGDINDHASIEIAMLHMHKLFFRSQGAQSIVEESQFIHITMGYRRWLNPYFSLFGGLYSAYPMDKPYIVHSDFAPGTEIETSARDLTEYGFDFAIQSELWHDNFISIVADARYSKSMTSKPKEKADHYGILLAIKYTVQEKRASNSGLNESK